MKRTDAELKQAVVDELSWVPSIGSSHIGVTTDEGVITLTGQVRSYPQKMAAGKAALAVRGVRAIAQEIVVHTAWSARSDSDLASEAAQALERAANVPNTITASVTDRVISSPGARPGTTRAPRRHGPCTASRASPACRTA